MCPHTYLDVVWSQCGDFYDILLNFIFILQAAAGLHLLVLRLEDLDVVWSQVLSLLALLVQRYKY